MLRQLIEFFKKQSEDKREASRLFNRYGFEATKVVAARIETARMNNDSAAVQRLNSVAQKLIAIERSSIGALHH